MSVTGTIGWTIGRGLAPAAMGGDIVLDPSFTGDGTVWDEYVGTSLIAEDNLTAAVLSANGPASVFHNLEFGTSFATFSSAIEGGIKWLAGASGTGSAGAGNGAGDPSGVGNGGSNGGDGVKRRLLRPVMERKITMAELVEGGGWRSLLQTGVTRASFTFDGLSSRKRISKKTPERVFGSLGGVVAIVCNMILIRKGEIPSGRGIQYEMMLTKASGEDGRGAILTELVVTGGKQRLSVEFIGIRTAEVTLGDVVERYSLDGLSRPVLKRPEKSYPERAPEGKDAGPTGADADQAIVDLWTLDFRRKDFAQTMKKVLVLLQKCSAVVFDQYLIDLLKVCDAYVTAQAVDEFKGETSGAVEKALSALQTQYGVWNGAADWYERVAVAVARLATAQAAGVGGGRDAGKTNGALNEADVKALLEALYHNGDGGIEFGKAMTKDSAVLRRDFETVGEGDPIRVQVKPSDILPFIEKSSLVEHRRSFKRGEIDRLVDIVALIRLGAGLHAGKLTAGQPADEDSISKTIDMIARSVAESRKIPVPVNPSLKARSAFKVGPWSGRLRLLLAGGRDKDFLVMEPITPDMGFESGAVVNDMISATGYEGRLWIIRPSGELAHDLGPAERQDVAAVAESVSEDEKIRRLGSVVTIGGMVEWVEDFLGAEVSRGSVFYSISPQRIVPLITHLASMCGEVGREFFARLASGAEAMARDVETEVRGFSVGVKVAPEILLRFLNDSKDRDGELSSFSVVAHTEIIDILASLRADWYSFVEEGRKIKGRMNEGLLKETERAVARHTGKYGTMPRPVTFRLDEGEWNTAMVIEQLRDELQAHPDSPFVFIVGPSPAGTVDRSALNEMISRTGFKSWFVMANVDGKTLYDSEEAKPRE